MRHLASSERCNADRVSRENRSFDVASTMQVTAWVLVALTGFWLLTAPQISRASSAADVTPGVILQHERHLPATAVPAHAIPRLAPCGYFLDHHDCPQTTAALHYGRNDLPGAPAPATLAWITVYLADPPDTGHARPPQSSPTPLYLRTSRLLI